MSCIGIVCGNIICIVKVSFENGNEYGTVLQFRIQSEYFKVFECIQMIFSNSKLGKY